MKFVTIRKEIVAILQEMFRIRFPHWNLQGQKFIHVFVFYAGAKIVDVKQFIGVTK